MQDRYIDEIPDRKEFLEKYEIKDVRIVKSLKNHEVIARKWRGNAGAHFDFKDMKVLNAHISELPPGRHSQKHRHSNEAIIYILAGKGYTIVHQEGQAEERIDWAESDLIGIPALFWHQHFNIDQDKTVRYLAVKNIPLIKKMGLFTVERPAEK